MAEGVEDTALLARIADVRAMLDAVELCASHQRRITEDVMRLSDLQAGRFAIEEAPFGLRNTVATVKRIFQTDAAAAGIRLDHGFSSACANWDLLVGDAQRIAQVLINLISNACKAIKVTSNGHTRPKHVRVAVDIKPLDDIN